jgi:hypothetical protein
LDFIKPKFQKRRADDERKKQQEIDMLQQQLQQLKDMASGKQVSGILCNNAHILDMSNRGNCVEL